MRPLTLKTRLTWWSSFVVAIGLMLSGALTALVVYRGEVAELDDQLEAEAASFFDEFERKGSSIEYLTGHVSEVRAWLPVSHPPQVVEISDAQDAVIYRSKRLADTVLGGAPAGFRNITAGKIKLRVAVFTRDGLSLRIAADLAPVEDLTRELLMAFLAALPVLLIFAFVGGRWIAARALDPIRQITESAMQVTAQHLERRVPLPRTNDEVEKLAIVLNRTFERLESSFHQAVRFSADASHELRTPITVLRSGIESLLLSPSLTEAEQVTVSGLLDQTQRISSIISGLLLLARADAGRLAVKMEPVDFRRLVELCLDDARIVADSAEISLKAELPQTASVRGEATRLMQIVSNLLDNAIKYNMPNGSVHVILGERDNAWVLDVSNTGPGIAPEHRDHLFDRFFRGEHVAEVGGQGLGLSLAHELARAHGGTLELVAADTHETVFRLTLEKAVANENAFAGKSIEMQTAEV